MKRYYLAPVARQDLQEIQAYVALASFQAARRLTGRFRQAFRRLADMPLIGHLREDLTERPFRFWSVASYLVIYRPVPDGVEIVRIVHGSRNVEALLD